ncbi:MAG: hypothetical protein ACJA1C_001595 [Crocinitomicaceae bacterium]|jgi:hypothetical protein
MEKLITIKNEYNSLEKVLELVKKETAYKCSEDYDIWDVRTDSNGQMEKCVVVKKSKMHGMKMYFPKENVLEMTYIIPNKMMNAYFGKSVKARRNILEIIGGGIKNVLLIGSQKKAFKEMSEVLNKVSA